MKTDRSVSNPPLALTSALAVSALWALSPSAMADFSTREAEGRIEILDDSELVFAWRIKPLTEPVGGERFAASAFIHPLTTPSGFVTTAVQPSDHLHHLGVWWPWKYVTADGRKHTTWEMQHGEGRHVAVAAEVKNESADAVTLSTRNQVQIKVDDKYVPAIDETAEIRLSRSGAETYVLDVVLKHQPADGKTIEVTRNHYSGFTWRGPEAWKAGNVGMLASGGETQPDANGKPADWFLTTGPAPAGKVSVLMMSGATKDGNELQKLRIWDAQNHGGTPFINFNPVVDRSKPVEAKDIASRRYRIVLSDKEISAEQAAKLWADWK